MMNELFRKTALTVITGIATLLLAVPVAVATTTWDEGDLFLAIGDGSYEVRDQDGNLKETLSTGRGGFTTGCGFDSDDNLYATEFAAGNVSVFDGAGAPHDNTIFDSGLSAPEMVVFDLSGNVYISNVQGNGGINQYLADGTFLKTIVPGTRVDFFDIAADQDTIAFGQEGNRILTASIASGALGPDFASDTGGTAFAMRFLPDGGLLVADGVNVKRYSSGGSVTDTYHVTGEGSWFALNLDPDGISFWAGTLGAGSYYQFEIDNGGVDVDTAGPFDPTGTEFFGLCLLGEPTVAMEEIKDVPTLGMLGLLAMAVALVMFAMVMRRSRGFRTQS
jgi:hypothetical protein